MNNKIKEGFKFRSTSIDNYTIYTISKISNGIVYLNFEEIVDYHFTDVLNFKQMLENNQYEDVDQPLTYKEEL